MPLELTDKEVFQIRQAIQTIQEILSRHEAVDPTQPIVRLATPEELNNPEVPKIVYVMPTASAVRARMQADSDAGVVNSVSDTE